MILNITRHDYANFMHDITQGMKQIGLEVEEMKKHPHEFGYENEAPIKSHVEFIDAIRRANVIQIFHSDMNLYQLVLSIAPSKSRIMYHTGTIYRQNHARINNSIDRRTKIVCALGELQKLAPAGSKYLVGAIDTNKITPRKARTGPTIFGHFPSNRTNKGTAMLEAMMNQHMDINYITSGTLLPHPDHLERLQECDVIIELFAPTQSGKPYGSFGMSALEAAAMAKVVITQNLTDDIYREHYGDHPLWLANSPKEFHDAINQLRDLSREQIDRLQEMTWAWVVNKHSLTATARYIETEIL